MACNINRIVDKERKMRDKRATILECLWRSRLKERYLKDREGLAELREWHRARARLSDIRRRNSLNCIFAR